MTPRRRAHILRGVLVTLAALAVWSIWLEPASLTTEEVAVAVGWPSQRPLRVAILTDLHVGSPFNGIGKLRAVVDRSNAARPDVVCVLGDLVIQGVIGGRFVPPETIADELSRLRAPAGVVAVLGNHDGWFNHDRVRGALAISDRSSGGRGDGARWPVVNRGVGVTRVASPF